MNYTNIRELVYRDRKSLDEFDILSDDESRINPYFYERLIEIESFHPKHRNSSREILQIFNDVYFFLTLFFLDSNPLIHYADYMQITQLRGPSVPKSEDIEWAELSMIYVILNSFYKTDWFKKKKSHAKMFSILAEDIEKRGIRYSNHLHTHGVSFYDSDKIVYTITRDFVGRSFYMNVEIDFPPRNIEDSIYDNESLEEFLLVGDEITEAINLICKDEQQKQTLVEKLLELEKNGYGKLDATINNAYTCLKELRGELQDDYTGDEPSTELLYEMAGNELEYFRKENKKLQKALDDANEKLKNKSEGGGVVGTVVGNEEEKPTSVPDDRVKLLAQYNESLDKISDLEEELREEKAKPSGEELKRELKAQKEIHEAMIVELLQPAFYGTADNVREFLKTIQNLDNQGVTDVVRQWMKDNKILPSKKGRAIWKFLHAAKLYSATEQNWNAALRKDDEDDDE